VAHWRISGRGKGVLHCH